MTRALCTYNVYVHILVHCVHNYYMNFICTHTCNYYMNFISYMYMYIYIYIYVMQKLCGNQPAESTALVSPTSQSTSSQHTWQTELQLLSRRTATTQSYSSIKLNLRIQGF